MYKSVTLWRFLLIMNFTIATDRLILRDFSPNDCDAYVSQCQDPKYQRFYDEEDCNPEKSKQLVELFIQQANQTPRQQFHLAITCKKTGVYMGIAGIRLEASQQASVGCGLARQYQSASIAEEAMKALISYGFNRLNVHRVYAETISQNRAAVHLCKRVGMRTEAEFIENRFFKHQWWSTTILAMLASEFNS